MPSIYIHFRYFKSPHSTNKIMSIIFSCRFLFDGQSISYISCSVVACESTLVFITELENNIRKPNLYSTDMTEFEISYWVDGYRNVETWVLFCNLNPIFRRIYDENMDSLLLESIPYIRQKVVNSKGIFIVLKWETSNMFIVVLLLRFIQF